MYVVTILMGLVVFVLLWLLFAPMVFIIDTGANTYSFNWFGIGRLQAEGNNDDIVLTAKLPFWKRQYSLLKLFFSKKRKQTLPPENQKSGRSGVINPKRPISNFLKIIKNGRLKNFQLDIDTGSYPNNAWLYTMYYWLNKGNRKVYINYHGRNMLQMEYHHSLFRMIVGYFRT